MDFADIKNDIAFRKIFGNEQKTAPLISFLNAALQLQGDERVVSVSLANPYQFPRIAGEKATILDVRATDQSGRKFVVEMQVADKKGFDKRVQYYIARDYSMQIDTGDDYPLLNPAYFIGILDFPFGEGDKYNTHHLMLDKETYEHLLKDIQFAFIQLPKFKLAMHELASPIDRWTYFIKNATALSVIPDFAQTDEGLNTAFLEADKHNWTKEERIAYDNVLMKETDEKQEKIKAAEKAREKGKEEGKEEKEIEAVLGLHENEVPVPIIAKSLKITEQRVLQIIENQKNR
jgi:predicted transposase/invertase (TIGR01784 family)